MALQTKKIKHFPCPYCTRVGQPSRIQGDCVDVSSGNEGPWMMQIAPDELCGGCGGEGFIPVGSKRHFDIKVSSAMNAISKIFGEEFIESLPELIYRHFYFDLEKTLRTIESEYVARTLIEQGVEDAEDRNDNGHTA